MLGVARVGLLLARFRRPYLGCIPDPQLVSQLGQQPLEPARRSAGFHPHPHRLSRQAAVKLLRLPAVLQSALTPLPSFRIHKSNLLKPRMKITAYNPHVGSFLRALVLFSDNQDTRLGADLIMQSRRTRRNAAKVTEKNKSARGSAQITGKGTVWKCLEDSEV